MRVRLRLRESIRLSPFLVRVAVVATVASIPPSVYTYARTHESDIETSATLATRATRQCR